MKNTRTNNRTLISWCAVMAVLALAAPARAIDPAEVSDPRPTHHVVDLTATLSEADIAAIDRAAARAGDEGELLVVLVPSVDGAAPRAWTTALFNRLELGKGRGNRGVLLMAALDDRRAEIVLGDGYPAATTSTTDRVMADVVARFRRGDPSGAMVAGADALVDGVVRPGVHRAHGVASPAATADDEDGARAGSTRDDDDDDALVVLVLVLSVLGFVAIVAVGLWLDGGSGDGGSSSSGSSAWSDGGSSSSSSSDSGSSSGSGSSGDW